MANLSASSLSVIITTYNNPRALGLVLTGLRRQTIQGFEVIVADDGSGPETAELLAGQSVQGFGQFRHLWQPDQGFRKCAILNQAITRAAGEYLIFFDGDCVPTAQCIEVHLRSAQPNSYLAGGAVSLTRTFSDRLNTAVIESGLLDRPGFWWRHVSKRRRLFIRHIPVVRTLMNRRVPRQPSWRGGNSSAWASDLHKVGGFDERFTYGFEDADLGHRLQAAGVQGRSIRYTSPVIHVEHDRPYADEAQIARNRLLYEENRAQRLVRTPHGIPSRG